MSLDTNGWYLALPELPDYQSVEHDETVDWAIVGAGCCGLAVARQLAAHRPRARIALIDTERVGWGASGRNAGFMLDVHAHGAPKSLTVLQRNMQLWRAGLDDLRSLVQRHRIECGWSEWGRLYVAVGQEGEARIAEMVASYEQLGVVHQPLTRRDVEQQTGTAHYSAGLKVEGSTLVQPAALMRGLAACLPENVIVFERSPVRKIMRNNGYELTCDVGTIRTKGIILANGVFITNLGWFRHRLVPVTMYASLTRQLDARERQFLPDVREFGLLPASANGSTIRLTPDDRLFVRNWATYGGALVVNSRDIADARALHRSVLDRRWPALRKVPLTTTWGGFQGFTRNDGAVFGQIGDEAYAVVTSDVSAVTRGTAAGKLLADFIVGADSDLLRLQRGFAKAALLPPDPILRYAVKLRLRKIRRVGASEE